MLGLDWYGVFLSISSGSQSDFRMPRATQLPASSQKCGGFEIRFRVNQGDKGKS